MNINRDSRIQGLRGISILLIVLWHLNSIFPNNLPSTGDKGVEFFFLISGYLVARKYLYTDKLDCISKAVKYVFIKFKKIYIYYILSAIPWIIVSMIKNILEVNDSTFWIRLLIYSLGAQSFVPNSDYYWAFNGVMWFWSTLLWCYLTTPHVFRISKKHQPIIGICFILVVEIVIEILCRTCMDNEMCIYITYIFPLYRTLDYMLGVLVCRLKVENRDITSKNQILTGALLIYIGISVWFDGHMLSSIYHIIETIIFVCIIVSDLTGVVRLIENAFTIFMGNISMELFFTHLPVIYIGAKVWKYIFRLDYPFIEWCLLLITTILFAYLLNKVTWYLNYRRTILK